NQPSNTVNTTSSVNPPSPDPFFQACYVALNEFFAIPAWKRPTVIAYNETHRGDEKTGEIGYYDQDGDIFFTDEDIKKIQKVYDVFYINRLNSEEMRKIKPKDTKLVYADDYSFRPEIDQRSKALAQIVRDRRKDEFI